MKEDKKKVFIKNFGCQMNVRDSEVICGLLKNAGYKITAEADKADAILFNTCSVRQHAEDKVWSEIGRYSRGHKVTKSPGHQATGKSVKPVLGIIGCMAQNYQEKIFERAPVVDFVVGPGDIHKIPEIVNKVTRSSFDCAQDTSRRTLSNVEVQGRKVARQSLFEYKFWETDGTARPEQIYHTGFHEDKEHAYVVISEGCSNYCSYCVVPYVRGELHNRSQQNILEEIREAIGKGITKITLLGQNVNAYNYEGSGFIELIRLVNAIKGLKEFSFVTSHPRDTSVELFQAMQDADKLKKYLHLPVQSGSNRILKLMNRNYTREFYLNLAGNFRRIVKGGALTTDIIVGYPTESEADFRDTYNLVKECAFNAAYIFKYSTRPRTQAASLADDVAKEEKERRHRIILELQKKISRSK